MFTARSAIVFIVLLAGVLLSGCSSLRIVDSQVAAFSKLDALPAASSWRFERLPSQQNLSDSQATRQLKLETMAAQELAKFGFKPQPENTGTAAKYSVQLSARFQRLDRGPFDPAFDAWYPYHQGWLLPGRDYVVTGSGRVIYAPVFPYLPPPWFVREVGLIIRDTADSKVVYETQARHEGRWADDEAVLPAMFTAALQGFPKPPEGKRMVNIEIPR
jgi:outer membrane murein-binding lipoprotein Lpp